MDNTTTETTETTAPATPELQYLKYTSKMTEEQLAIFAKALAESDILKIPAIEGDVTAESVAAVLEGQEHVDIVTGVTSVSDANILEILMSQPLTRAVDTAKPRPRTARDASSKTPREPKAPRLPKEPVVDTRVIVSVKPNPKRPGSQSHARYENYRAGMTVAEALAAGLTRGDIVYDTSHQFITFEDSAPAQAPADEQAAA